MHHPAQINRRTLLQTLATSVGACYAISNSVLATDKPSSLKEAAKGRFRIGVGIDHNITQRPEDWDLLLQQFEILTPENCMKTQSVQPEEGVFRFENADKFVAFAKEHDLDIVGHCLIWAKDDRTSDWWMKEGEQNVSADKLLQRLRTHIETVAGRYAGKIAMWDVVNEAVADGDGEFLRDSIWTRTTNEEFLVQAFKTTKQADPQAMLLYNEYNCHQAAKRDKLIRLLKSLQDQGAPVDAVGLQEHYELDQIPLEELEKTLEAIGALGLKVCITELDIDVVQRSKWWAENGKYRDELAKFDPYKDGCPEELLERQAEQYRKLFQLFVKHDKIIERVSFWNLHDGQSWLNYFPWNRVNYPLLFDRKRQPKPAYSAVLDALT